MVLLETAPGALVTQGFGVSSIEDEPSMWFNSEKAYWFQLPGLIFSRNFHPGIDRRAAHGDPLVAMESGRVVFAAWKDNISGRQVEIEIRPGTRFSVNHLLQAKCKVGDVLAKGDVMGLADRTGITTGDHTHEGLSIVEPDANGVHRTFLYNPALFQKGGKYANDPRIQPEHRFAHVIAPEPIWFAGKGYDDRGDVFAFARTEQGDRPAGIFRQGRRLAGLGYDFGFVRYRDVSIGKVAIVTGFGRRLAIRADAIHVI